MTTYSKCGEFVLDEGWVYHMIGFPDAWPVVIGHADLLDADEAPARIRPAIVELLDLWRDGQRDAGNHADLNADYRAAALP
jgi:hypothetical protein